jgi:hypothetical protein
VAEAGFVGQSDPLIREFDVRFNPRKRVRTAPMRDTANDDEEDAEGLPAKKNAKWTEPPRRIVTIPGYVRDLRMRASPARQLYEGSIVPAWGVKGAEKKHDEQGMELLEFRFGDGAVTLINGLWRFGNYGIDSDDHAELIAALVATHSSSGQVLIMTRLGVPSLWEWLGDHAQAAVVSALVLLAAWLWHVIPRFGIVRTETGIERRSLIEHFRAVGRFLWRNQSLGVLLAAARANLSGRLALRHPTAESGAHSIAELARRTGVQERAIHFALIGTPASPVQFVEAFRTLQELEHKLR